MGSWTTLAGSTARSAACWSGPASSATRHSPPTVPLTRILSPRWRSKPSNRPSPRRWPRARSSRPRTRPAAGTAHSEVWSAPGSGIRRSGDQLGQELADAGVDVVADAAHDLDGLAGRVREFPVLIALARIDRAGIPAAHGDDGVGGADELVAQGLGELAGQVDAPLVHGRHDRRVDGVAGGAAG